MAHRIHVGAHDERYLLLSHPSFFYQAEMVEEAGHHSAVVARHIHEVRAEDRCSGDLDHHHSRDRCSRASLFGLVGSEDSQDRSEVFLRGLRWNSQAHKHHADPDVDPPVDHEVFADLCRLPGMAAEPGDIDLDTDRHEMVVGEAADCLQPEGVSGYNYLGRGADDHEAVDLVDLSDRGDIQLVDIALDLGDLGDHDVDRYRCHIAYRRVDREEVVDH